MPDIRRRLGERIRTLRTQRSFSQESFAHECGFHRTYIGAVERGEKNISILNLEVIAKKLKVTVSDLFRDVA